MTELGVGSQEPRRLAGSEHRPETLSFPAIFPAGAHNDVCQETWLLGLGELVRPFARFPLPACDTVLSPFNEEGN